MPPLLQYGSVGPFVSKLQGWLNLLPSALSPLGVDGIFGPKTTGRVKEFQRDNNLQQDGQVGPMTWAEAEELVGKLFNDPTLGKRLRVAGVARVEAQLGSHVAMKVGAGVDPADPRGRQFRKGYERVLQYFQGVLSPSQFQGARDDVIHLTTAGKLEPCKHWCGIFALWAIRTAQVPVGLWDLHNGGISLVKGFKNTNRPRVGDVGFVNNGKEHHVLLLEDPFVDGFERKIRTVEGNSEPASNFNVRTRPYKDVKSWYTCY